MEPNYEKIRFVLLNRFRNGDNAAKAYRYLCNSYQSEMLSERQCRRWFERPRQGDLKVIDRPGRGRKLVLELEELRQTIYNNPRQTTRDLALILNVSQKTISNALKRIKYTNGRGTWVPHELSE